MKHWQSHEDGVHLMIHTNLAKLHLPVYCIMTKLLSFTWCVINKKMHTIRLDFAMYIIIT